MILSLPDFYSCNTHMANGTQVLFIIMIGKKALTL